MGIAIAEAEAGVNSSFPDRGRRDGSMASEVTRRFMEALQDAERTGDVGPLVGLFADDAELSNLAGAEPGHYGFGEGATDGSLPPVEPLPVEGE